MHTIYPWQQQQWQYLMKRKDSAKLPHGLLLTGARGLGKYHFALAFAELLLCEHNAETAQRLIQAGNHPDLHILQPEATGKAIKVDQIRTIIDITARRSHQGGYQIIIIEPADAMNINAANALLKTLEEPLGEVIILLITDRPALLPATIRSRCQKLGFHAPTKEVAHKWLQQHIDNNIDNLLALTNNAPLLALQLGKDNTYAQYQTIANALMDLITGKIDALKFSSLCLDMEQHTLLNYLQMLLLDMLRGQFTKKTAITVNTNAVIDCYDKIINLIKYNSNNLNPQLMLEDLSLYMEAKLSAS